MRFEQTGSVKGRGNLVCCKSQLQRAGHDSAAEQLKSAVRDRMLNVRWSTGEGGEDAGQSILEKETGSLSFGKRKAIQSFGAEGWNGD